MSSGKIKTKANKRVIGVIMKKMFFQLVLTGIMAFVPLFSNAQTSGKPATNDPRMLAFAQAWFRGFDYEYVSNAQPVSVFFEKLAPGPLAIKFPADPLITTPAEFEKWYNNILANIAKAKHTVKSVVISAKNGNAYDVTVRVLWEARDSKGTDLAFHARQRWVVLDTPNGLKLQQNYVAEDKQP